MLHCVGGWLGCIGLVSVALPEELNLTDSDIMMMRPRYPTARSRNIRIAKPVVGGGEGGVNEHNERRAPNSISFGQFQGILSNYVLKLNFSRELGKETFRAFRMGVWDVVGWLVAERGGWW